VTADLLEWNEQARVWSGTGPFEAVKKVLIVVSHPDDVESQAGGAVTLLTRAGADVRLVMCTSGDKGSSDRSLTSAELGAMREAEQLEAAKYLGISSVDFLRWPDGDVEPGKKLRETIVRRIREHQPDVVITHDPVHPWPPYRAHRDHRTVGRTTLDAMFPDARDHLSFPEHLREGLEPHVTSEAWLIM
jgi:LmbE family N-acetylglucosaminyl deacetylase